MAEPVLGLSSPLLVLLIDWWHLNLDRDGARNRQAQAALSPRDAVHKALVDVVTH